MGLPASQGSKVRRGFPASRESRASPEIKATLEKEVPLGSPAHLAPTMSSKGSRESLAPRVLLV